MISRFTRLLLLTLVPLALTACTTPEPAAAEPSVTAALPLGADLGPSTRIPTQRVAITGHEPHARPAADRPMRLVHDGRDDAHATGTVNSVDPTQHKINLSHQPIPEIGWPAMTMDFPVAASVDLKSLKPGMRVNVTLEKDKSGMYQIQSLQPAGGSH
jgi:Cu/Ag efflux protein CusF